MDEELKCANERAACHRPQFLPVVRHSGFDGTLGVVDFADSLPFTVQRVYFHTAVPLGTTRGEHGHLRLLQFVVALRGEISIKVIGASGTQHFLLTDSGPGLFLPQRVWRALTFETSDAVSLVFASEPYDPSDYVTLEQLRSTWAGT